MRTLTKRHSPTPGVYVPEIVISMFISIVAVCGCLAVPLDILVAFSALQTHQAHQGV